MVEIERLVNQAVLLVKPETIESKHAHLQSWSVKKFGRNLQTLLGTIASIFHVKPKSICGKMFASMKTSNCNISPNGE